MPNAFQRACAHAYGHGDFADIQNIAAARETGDTLFAFLIIEVALNEGCNSAEAAVRRLDMAMADIQAVAEAVQRGGAPPRS